MVFIYPNTLGTFQGDREIALKSGYIEIEDTVYNDLVETKLKWKDGKIVQDTTYETRKEQERQEKAEQEQRQSVQSEIAKLKRNLAETDYVVVKIAEGVATKEEYISVLANRQWWRDRINELEL